jgi:hypothetical protein
MIAYGDWVEGYLFLGATMAQSVKVIEKSDSHRWKASEILEEHDGESGDLSSRDPTPPPKTFTLKKAWNPGGDCTMHPGSKLIFTPEELRYEFELSSTDSGDEWHFWIELLRADGSHLRGLPYDQGGHWSIDIAVKDSHVFPKGKLTGWSAQWFAELASVQMRASC